jgi:hypothetical protein
MNRTSRLASVVLVIAVVVASPALPQTNRHEAPPRTSFAEAIRGFLPTMLSRLLDDEGCGADPFGICRPAAVRPGGKSSITSIRAEAGCDIDPFGGHCTVASQPSGSGVH